MADTPPLHSVSVAAAIVADDGRVLVIQRRDNGAWEPPGGVLELDESITDGLRREVHEETGLEVEPDGLTGVYKNMSRGIVALVFRCHPTGGELKTTDETMDARWLSRDEVSELMSAAFSVRLLDALEDESSRIPARRGPYVRIHDGVNLLPDQQ